MSKKGTREPQKLIDKIIFVSNNDMFTQIW